MALPPPCTPSKELHSFSGEDFGERRAGRHAHAACVRERCWPLPHRPFKGEVLDAKVTTVNKLGFFAEVCARNSTRRRGGTISLTSIASRFHQVGPLNVFVSKHLIPKDMLFDPHSNPPSYVSQVSDEQPTRVTVASEVRPPVRFSCSRCATGELASRMIAWILASSAQVRLRLIGTRVDASEIFAIGSIKEDYLGVISR